MDKLFSNGRKNTVQFLVNSDQLKRFCIVKGVRKMDMESFNESAECSIKVEFLWDLIQN